MRQASYEDLAEIALELQAERDALRADQEDVRAAVEHLLDGQVALQASIRAADDKVRSEIRQWKEASVAEIALRERIIAQLRQQVSSATTVRKVVRDEDSNITAIVEVPTASSEAQELIGKANRRAER